MSKFGGEIGKSVERGFAKCSSEADFYLVANIEICYNTIVNFEKTVDRHDLIIN